MDIKFKVINDGTHNELFVGQFFRGELEYVGFNTIETTFHWFNYWNGQLVKATLQGNVLTVHDTHRYVITGYEIVKAE